jgi:Tol biopolymer transport system component
VAEDVIAADWSPAGELAVIRKDDSHSRCLLEFPSGKALFEARRPAWLGGVRVSPRGDLVALVHYPVGDIQGEVVILDRQGKKLQSSRHWYRVFGLAWSPRNDEVWFTAGSHLPTLIQAMSVGGSERTVYTALSPMVIQDIAADGSVLIGQGSAENDLTFLGDGAPNPRSLGWDDWSDAPRLSADGRLLLFSAFGSRKEPVALLRRTSGTPPENLGEGVAGDLSPDGRWALLRSADGLTVVSTGTGTRRHIPLPRLSVLATRFLGGTSQALSIARASDDPNPRLYSINLDGSGAAPASEPLGRMFFLQVSPDGRWAVTNAMVDGKFRPVLHSLAGGGKPVALPVIHPGVAAYGWGSNDDEVWFATDDEADPSILVLTRFDVRRKVILEERRIGTGGSGVTGDVHLTPDGKNIVFTQQRISGHLYVIRGMAAR